MEAIGLKEFLNYRFLSQVRYAPDGKRAAFVVSNCNEEDNCYESRIWLYDGEIKPLTDVGKESSFIWLDENRLLFNAVRSAKEKKRAEKKDIFTSYYVLDVRGGEAMPAFTLPFAAMSVRRLEENLFLVYGMTDANNPDFYKMDEEERGKVLKSYQDDKDYEVFDEIPFWSNGRGVMNKRRLSMFIVETDPAGKDPVKIERITNPLFSAKGSAVRGDFIYYSGNEYETKSKLGSHDIYRYDRKTGENKLLAHDENVNVHDIVESDGRILVIANTMKAHGLNENASVYLLDEEAGTLSLLRHEEYNMYSDVGSDCRYGGGGESSQARGSRVYHLTTREGSSHLYALESSGDSTPIVTKEGSIDGFSVNENAGEALLIALYDGRLQELYAADIESGEVRRLSHFNDDVLKDKYVAEYNPVSVKSCGYDIGGWVLLPKDYSPEKSYPAIFDIHGGPKTVYGPVFYHEMQLWANMGYFVFFCNPKGSDGRDNDFMDIRGHYGETDYQNLMDFADAVLEKYPQIDKKRVCVTGGSYGGFMTNWIIGHTDRFCCAASQRSISNWLSYYGVSDIGFYFAVDQCDGDIFDTPEQLWKQSPLRYASDVKTPTLFIHSDEDYRCPLEQGIQMYTALAVRGVPARMCVFHGENHELSRSGKPLHRIRRLTEMTDWFEKYSG